MKRLLVPALLWACLALMLAGCVNRHKVAVNTAKTRWLTMRTAQMLALAYQQFEMGDLDQSEATVGEALAQDGASPSLLIMAGRIALERGRLERSYHYFKQAQDGDPNIAVAHYYQAVVFERWSQHEAALAAYRRAYALEPDNVAYLLAIGETLVALDRVDKALQTLQAKLIYFEQNAGIQEAVGRLLLVTGDRHGAVDHFKQASLLKPGDLQIAEELALAYLKAGQYDEAIRVLTRLRQEGDPQRRHYIDMALVNAYQRAGRVADARTICRDLTRSAPDDPTPWIRMAELAWAEGDLGTTLASAGKIRRLAPENHVGYLFAGMVWHQRGDTSRAAPLFEQASQLDIDNAESAILQGISLEASGLKQAAADAYREALRRQPNDERASRLLVRVEAK